MIEGNGPPPSLVLELIRGLPDDSMTAALNQGGIQYLGWGVDRHMNASMYDALSVNTAVSGNWRSKPPKFPPYPRPQKTIKKNQKVSVAQAFAALRGGASMLGE